MDYEHLRFDRENPLTERHPRQYRGGYRPDDPKAYGTTLGRRFSQVRQRELTTDLDGFDNRKLLKLRLHSGDKSVPNFEAIPGVEIVSQEDEAVVLVFTTEEGLNQFESRLSTLARDGVVTRKELLYAIEDFDNWTAEDRRGVALRNEGLPNNDLFMLDVELWPQERQDKREELIAAFSRWLRDLGAEQLDIIIQPSLLMVRIRCNHEQVNQLLRYRDVRTVDLPPRLGVSIGLISTDVNQFPPINPPPDGVPSIAVLDSGLTPGHTLLGEAVGDVQGYLEPQRSPDDTAPDWHGTFVGGLALYGDIHTRIQQGEFVPQLRLFSGKVFEDDGHDQTEFVEKAVETAVLDIYEQYGCRVFNLSYGDLNKVYDGRHVRGLAYTLDRLTRELGVLFVVPTGNLSLQDLPENPIDTYPDYLFSDEVRLLDPATALNALTVGGLSTFEATRETQRYPNTIEDYVFARSGQPFPLTRCGPSVNNAIKPDVIEHAGNLALMRDGGRVRYSGLGIVSLNGGFATGVPFAEDIGTSYAAPQVAHKAAKLLAEVPNANPNLLRALLGAHARWPQPCVDLINPRDNSVGRDKLLRLIGYGQVDETALYRSLNDTVTLLAEEHIDNDRHHFFELPMPESFWSRGRREREITVALAYSPVVRTTRLDYRSSKLWFTLVAASSLEEVTRAFRRNREEGMGERSNNRWLPNDTRKTGTLQVSRWKFIQPLSNGNKIFVVVTRQDSPWSLERDAQEPYSLAITLADRENAEAELYVQARDALQSRVQTRARAIV
ncbi:S8 family peptidase [Desulfuromonas acetoxidans]|uniref:Serine protease n=1 Tax=Desulfuromonas acetoxidans (strain DSM 684 / 11070) TaxID=281689 RepID=Q1JWT7_DESA6|nr:S8 family peptidase [Desulfuromonas acetoxidans]EAT14707.1 putative serine protease [Desulfuromonas acetoxidans DSM 684]MBF0646295.1 S8 family peptidase [Desulfuromonas acetoxidans]NVD25103.1 S8 family peptidase [Desulfuromonas acetoxidans]NVE17276.1 S8 family peptidase [Desulfuromonas acetoxidans]